MTEEEDYRSRRRWMQGRGGRGKEEKEDVHILDDVDLLRVELVPEEMAMEGCTYGWK